jgi:hypothetical protein
VEIALGLGMGAKVACGGDHIEFYVKEPLSMILLAPAVMTIPPVMLVALRKDLKSWSKIEEAKEMSKEPAVLLAWGKTGMSLPLVMLGH